MYLHDNSAPDTITNAEPDTITNSEPDSFYNTEPDSFSNARTDFLSNARTDCLSNTEPDSFSNTDPDTAHSCPDTSSNPYTVENGRCLHRIAAPVHLGCGTNIFRFSRCGCPYTRAVHSYCR